MPHPYHILPPHHQRRFYWTMFKTLRIRDFFLLWVANFFSNFGTATYVLALNWIAVKDHGGAGLAAVTLAYGISKFFLPLLGGAVSDRVDRKTLYWRTELVLALSALILAGCATIHFTPLWFLVLNNGFNGACSAFDTPARTTLINELVPSEDIVNAQELYGLATNITAILGPALGGLLMATGDVSVAFWFNSLSFLPVLISLRLIRVNTSTPLTISSSKTNLFQSIGEGIGYVRQEKTVRTLLLLMGIIMVLGMPYQTLLPIYVHDVLHLGSSEFAALSSASGFGAVLGGVVATALNGKNNQGRWLLKGSLGAAFALLLFSQSSIIHLASLSIFWASLCTMSVLNLDSGLIQVATVFELRGRVTSICDLNKGVLSFSTSLASYGSDYVGMIAVQLFLVALMVISLLFLSPSLLALKVQPERNSV